MLTGYFSDGSAQQVKNPPAMEEEMATHSSISA